ncbi:MAG: translation elongation factor Ts [Actinomycetota bacterium]|nr:translation elongation factor Ts [Actinomycetota bacterium]
MSDEPKISAEQVKALRDATGAGMMDCKRALQETGGDKTKATEWLRQKGLDSAKKRAGRSAGEGVIDSYIHFNARVGVLVEVNCETDFVANTGEFRQLARDVALHIASARPRWLTRDEVPQQVLDAERRVYEGQAREEGKPDNVVEKMVTGKLEGFFKENVLVDQPFIKDTAKTVGELVEEASGKLGEKVAVRRFARFQLGEDLD